MKRFSILAICACVVLTSACEKHPASQLPAKHGAGEKHAEVKGDAHHPATPAVAHPEPAKPDAAKPADAAKPGEAPKFFPENK